jgi:tol-pal system protein YbgF
LKNRLSLLALLACLFLAPTAQAGLFDDDEARRRIEQMRQDLEQRLQKVEASNAVVLNNQQTQAAQLETLRQDLARLLGQVEVLANDSEQAQKRQKDFYIDLDARLRRVEGTITQLQQAATQAQAAKPEPPPVDPAQESRDYEAAINALRAGKHVDAAFGFKQFIKAWPKSGFLPGANFWLAASLMQANDLEGARDTYAKVAATWPEDALAPDALLGQASAEQELKDAKASRATLEKLVAKYPASEAAKTARQRLKKK